MEVVLFLLLGIKAQMGIGYFILVTIYGIWKLLEDFVWN